MQIRISHSDLVDSLVCALNQTDCSAARTGAHGVHVHVPWLERGGDPRQARIEVLFFIRSWGLPHVGFDAQLA